MLYSRFAIGLLPGLLLLLGTMSAHAETFSIGEKGTQITLGRGWSRKESVPGLGKDQFLGPRGVRLALIEAVTALDEGPGAQRAYEEWIESIGALESVEIKSSFGPVVSDEVPAIARGMIRANEQGQDVAYSFAVISQGGLRYSCSSFARQTLSEEVDAAIDQVANTVRFPKPDSEWSNSVKPHLEAFRFDWGTVQISYRRPLWQAEEGRTGFFRVEELNSLLGFYGFEVDRSTEEYAESLTPYLAESYKDYKEVSRTPFQLGPHSATKVLGVGEGGSRVVHSLIVPVNKERCLEFRLNAPYPRDIADRVWERWVRGLSGWLSGPCAGRGRTSLPSALLSMRPR